ncbi:MAG: hypothetical protein JW987_05145 [Anaerolineaceae bacterium]|nr:hypothetical protein [Anaerolineaceae bacterium]
MKTSYESLHKNETAKFAVREADWRNGAIVYQVIVDRFAPSQELPAKQHLYADPRKLRKWDETPARGYSLPEHHVWTHELDFWGGDLNSLRSKLKYIMELGADVLYLNPIHKAFTNHKYDATDYMEISPEYGTRDDLTALIQATHESGMKIVLDGVFNHMGRQSPIFQSASTDRKSLYRDWFYFGDEFPRGVRLWANAPSLPELNFENLSVCNYIYGDPNSVVRSYLRQGIDGWRLDTAFELGYQYLAELTAAAHVEQAGSLVVGEIWNYPQEWFPALDAVMNFTLRETLLQFIKGTLSPAMSGQFISKIIADAGIEPILKSWLLLDNHDLPRVTAILPDPLDQRLAQALQFTLPGSPNLYYGSEFGMEGGEDPANRAPMRWDLLTLDNAVLQWHKTLIQLRKRQRALRIGDYREVLSSKLLAFERCTEKTAETLVIVANPTGETVQEKLLVPDSRIMNGTRMVDLLGNQQPFFIFSAILDVTVPPKSALVLQPQTGPFDGYTPYKRIL